MLYLRDLKDETREQIERLIRTHRPELIERMEDGKDIQVGEIFSVDDFIIED